MRCLVVAFAIQAAVATPWNGNATAPRQVHLAFTEDPSGMLFSWSTGTPMWAKPSFASSDNATAPSVQLGLTSGVYTRTVNSNYSLMYAGVGDVTHRVNASGLAAGTRYFYRVGDSVLDQWSVEASFMSRPAAGAEQVLDFIAYGDMGYWNGSSTVVQAAVAAEIARGAIDFAFVTHVGDISYAGLYAQSNLSEDTLLWDLFMDEIEPISSSASYLVAPGNHDVLKPDSGTECGDVYVHRFKMPSQNESQTDFSCDTSTNVVYWYSLAVGPVWLHSFSTEHTYAPGSPQLAWIEADLNAAVAARRAGTVSWIIVQMHYPSYCSHSYNGGGGCITDAPIMRAALEALWKAAGVDVVIYGHIHAAEVTWPVYNSTPTAYNWNQPIAPTHFLIGMAGAGYLGPWQTEQPVWSAWRDQVYGWTRFHVEGSKRLDFMFYSYLDATVPAWNMSITH